MVLNSSPWRPLRMMVEVGLNQKNVYTTVEGLTKHHTWVVFWKVAFAFDLQKRVEHGWVDDQETKKISHNIWSQEVLMMRAVLTILDQQPYLIDCSNSSKSYQGYPRIKPLAQGKYHWNTLQIPSSSSDKNSRHLHKPKKWAAWLVWK